MLCDFGSATNRFQNPQTEGVAVLEDEIKKLVVGVFSSLCTIYPFFLPICQKLIGLFSYITATAGILRCHTVLQRWSTSMGEMSSQQRQTFG